MSETVMIALITLASGAIGAVSGAFATIFAARHGAKVQLQQSVLKEYFAARLSAFNAVYDAYKHYTRNADDLAMRIQLLDAVNRACLVASQDTARALEKFAAKIPLDDSSQEKIDAFHSARMSAFHAMDNDMKQFKMPKIDTTP